MSPYVEQRDGGYYFTGSRVTLDSIVYEFLRGESPEGITQSYASLTLEQVYGGITYYLSHRDEIDAHLRAGERRFEELAAASRAANPQLYAKLDSLKRASPNRG